MKKKVSFVYNFVLFMLTTRDCISKMNVGADADADLQVQKNEPSQTTSGEL